MPEPTTTTIALRVDGGACWEWDPDVALLTVDAAWVWVKEVLAQMAQVAGLKADDGRICAVERSLNPLRWRTDPDTRDGRLLNDDWAALDMAEVLALRSDEEVGVTVVTVTQVTTEDAVYWRPPPSTATAAS